MIQSQFINDRYGRSISALPERLRRLVELRHQVKLQRKEAGRRLMIVQSQLGAARHPGEKRRLREEVETQLAKLRRLDEVLEKNRRLLDEEEDRAKAAAPASYEQVFMEVVRDSVPLDQFKSWCRIAGTRFNEMTFPEEPQDEVA